MKAVRCHRYVGLDDQGRPLATPASLREALSLDEIPPPACEPGQVLVQTRYAGVQYPDALQAQGLYQQRPRLPYVPGMDVSGMVLELGDGVDGLAVGDEVFAQMSVGGLAEVAAAPASSVWAGADRGPPVCVCESGAKLLSSLLLLEDSR